VRRADRDCRHVLTPPPHRGQRFSYTRYEAAPGKAVSLSSRVAPAPEVPIHTSIRRLDARGMAAITFPARESAHDAAGAGSSSGDADEKTASEAQAAFRQYLKDTRNTICGRHPISVLLGALSALEEAHGQHAECRFTRYEVSRASSAAPPALTRPAAKLAVPARERQQRLVRERDLSSSALVSADAL